MNGWLWLLAGLLVGTLNVAAIARSVVRLRPGGDWRALSSIVGGFFLRLMLSALLLAVALQQSAMAGLLAFTGLWLGRCSMRLWTHHILAFSRKIEA